MTTTASPSTRESHGAATGGPSSHDSHGATHRVTIHPRDTLKGTLRVPGDKSISHRSLIFSALSRGRCRVKDILDAGDVRSTAASLRAMGVPIEWPETGDVVVDGIGPQFKEPELVLDCGNSGTTTRLLIGLVSSMPIACTFAGDASLSRRPMARVTGPLRQAGAEILGRSDGNRLPLTVKGGKLRDLHHVLPVASAQVKSALLLAALSSSMRISLEEPGPTRDHTERMLRARGVKIEGEGRTLVLQGPQALEAGDWQVPADPSSAAFFVVAGLLARGGEVVLESVGLNRTRVGFLEVLEAMGAHLQIEDRREIGGEPVGTLRVTPGPLRGTEIRGEDLVPRLIDEIPILAVAACHAEGETTIRDASELRAKESDRIRAMVSELRKLGADVEELEDGMRIRGKERLEGGTVESHDDHRIAMSMAVAGLRAKSPVVVNAAECVGISYPAFFDHLATVAPGAVDRTPSV